MLFRSMAVSHPGVRTRNQDSGYASPTLVVVADGVGGGAVGEVASALGTHVVVSSMLTGRGLVEERLVQAVGDAQMQLRRAVEAHPERSGMATTLTAVAVAGERVALAHLGDSRCYRLHANELLQLSRDHNLLQVLPEQEWPAVPKRLRSVVTRALDHVHQADPDVLLVEVAVGDRLLLCSDGVSNVLSDVELADALRWGDADQAAQTVLDAALHAGGHDNLTCVVADLREATPVTTTAREMVVGAAADPRNLADLDRIELLRYRRTRHLDQSLPR